VITILPKNTHHRRSNIEINGKFIEDWIHPFIHSTSDKIIEDYKELPDWISRYVEGNLEIKNIEIIDKAIEYFENIGK
jgi:hypothetical protein